MKRDCYFDFDDSTEVCHGLSYNMLLVVGVVIDVVYVILVYAYIRCCCPTSLRRERKGLVLSDSASPPEVRNPYAVQQPMAPFENAGMDSNLHMMPPPYSTMPLNPPPQ